MNIELDNLKPSKLFHYFSKFNKIPRCSENGQRIGEYLINLAQEKKLELRQDDAGNIVIRKNAAHGKENAPTVVVQSHTDMVCEKNKDTPHDFLKDPIKMKVNGEWLTADGTTLGADNGIGVAASLALLDDDSLLHGPLELLFTTDEETGLVGANRLQPDFISGRILINTDSEEEGVLIIGCAGGRDTIGKLQVERDPEVSIPSDSAVCYGIRVGGLKGGHSGIDIHLPRGNAIKILAEILKEIMGYNEGKNLIQIISITGGSKRNAIPREAEGIVLTERENRGSIKSLLEKIENELKKRLKQNEPDLFLKIEEVNKSHSVPTSVEFSRRLIELLLEIPHGVMEMSADVDGLVETSTNLATVVMENDAITIGTSQRSFIDSKRDAAAEEVTRILESKGASATSLGRYPGWHPDASSNTLQVAKNVLQEYYGKEPKLMAIHAGLECGIIGNKYPGMDMISLGPTILNPHSPDEKVYIPSIENFYNCLRRILERLAK